jgi:uncharacterized DUF497 family protein
MNVVRRLIWDDWNVEHIAAHAVTPQEVEEVCHSNPVVRRTRQKRLLVIGRTLAGEYLTVILDPEGNGIFYPVTARPASHIERHYYHRQKAGELE